MQHDFSRESDARLTDKIGVIAYIGLLCSAGALQRNKQSVEEVRVTDGDDNEIFLLVMDQKPFKILIRCILE